MKSGTPTHELDAAAARLDDYLRGAMPDEQVDDFEEDLFQRALSGSAPELGFRASLAATFRKMNARGTLDIWLTSAEVERVRARRDLRVMFFELDLERPVPPEVPAGTDLLITRVPVDLQGISRLEAEVFSPEGQLLKRMPDVTFDPADGAVYACCEAELARTASAATRTTTRVWAVEESGRRLVLELPGF